MKSNVKQWLVLLWVVMTHFSYAEEIDLIERSWDFGMGVGFGEQSNPFIGADEVPGYLTLDLAIYGERFFFDNGDLGFTLVDRPSLGINLLANYSSERIYYSYFNELGLFNSGFGASGANDVVTVIPTARIDDNNPVFGAVTPLILPDRDFAVNLGVEALFDTGIGQLQWQIAKDVSGAHNGFEMELDFNHVWAKGRWAFKPNVGVSWKSEKLIDYYYGIENFTESFLLNYRGEATTNVSLGFLLSYRINNHLSYVNHFKYTHLGNGIRKSPLIDANATRSYFSGLYYRF